MTLSRISLVMLASGTSERFGTGDKLLASFHGKALGAWSAELMHDVAFYERIAVVPKASPARRALFDEAGWTVIENADPQSGQANSLKLAVAHVAASPAEALVFCLSDMPFIREAQIRGLITVGQEQQAAMCNTGAFLTPPAFFARETFQMLMTLDGDRGAKSVFHSLERTATFAISPMDARDIDTQDDLMSYSRGDAAYG